MSLPKEDRVQQLIAICVKNDKTPKKVGFADFIYGVSAVRFLLSHKTVKEYIQVLVDAWRQDKWKHLVKSNDYLSREEKETWLTKL